MGNIRFGTLTHMQTIPAPESGMGFDLNRDTETTELVSGGRSIYRAPSGYKSYSMSWKGGTEGLQGLMDMHAGEYGRGPFYMYDPRYENDNLLPAKWANSYQLAYTVNGWGRPTVSIGYEPSQSGMAVYFSRQVNDPTYLSTYSQASTIVPVEQYKALYLQAHGTVLSGVAGIDWVGIDSSGQASEPTLLTPDATGNPTQILTADHSYVAIGLSLHLEAGSNLALWHMDLSHNICGSAQRSGKGVGPVHFDGTMKGTLVGTKVGRIGLAIDLIEVQKQLIPWTVV